MWKRNLLLYCSVLICLDIDEVECRDLGAFTWLDFWLYTRFWHFTHTFSTVSLNFFHLWVQDTISARQGCEFLSSCYLGLLFRIISLLLGVLLCVLGDKNSDVQQGPLSNGPWCRTSGFSSNMDTGFSSNGQKLHLKFVKMGETLWHIECWIPSNPNVNKIKLRTVGVFFTVLFKALTC